MGRKRARKRKRKLKKLRKKQYKAIAELVDALGQLQDEEKKKKTVDLLMSIWCVQVGCALDCQLDCSHIVETWTRVR